MNNAAANTCLSFGRVDSYVTYIFLDLNSPPCHPQRPCGRYRLGVDHQGHQRVRPERVSGTWGHGVREERCSRGSLVSFCLHDLGSRGCHARMFQVRVPLWPWKWWTLGPWGTSAGVDRGSDSGCPLIGKITNKSDQMWPVRHWEVRVIPRMFWPAWTTCTKAPSPWFC